MTTERTRIERYDPAAIEPRWQARWAELGLHRTDLDDTSRPQVLPPDDVRLPVGQPPRRPLVREDADRRAGPLPPDARPERLLPGRLRRLRAAGRERGDQEPDPPGGVDRRGTSRPCAASCGAWARRSTGTPRSSPATRPTTAGTSGSSCASSRPAWPTGRRRPVDWCPNDGTLAREQVEGADRRCWRCGAKVEKRDLAQWFLRITKYADELLDFTGIDWPEPIRVMQTNWIGRSEGAEVVFRSAPDTHLAGRRRDPGLHDAPGHALRGDVHGPRPRAPARRDADLARASAPSSRRTSSRPGRETEIERLSTERDKTGVPLGADAINPVNGERIPIWIADYVLSGYGTGRDHGRPGPRRARLRLRPPVRPRDPRGDPAGGHLRRGARAGRAPTSRRRPTTSSSTRGATTAWPRPRRSGRSPPTSRRAARARPPSATGSATG